MNIGVSVCESDTNCQKQHFDSRNIFLKQVNHTIFTLNNAALLGDIRMLRWNELLYAAVIPGKASIHLVPPVSVKYLAIRVFNVLLNRSIIDPLKLEPVKV